jgi:hypothetical protein
VCTDIDGLSSAEAGASVEPVIALELIDFDALPVVARCQRHGRGVGHHSSPVRSGRKVPASGLRNGDFWVDGTRSSGDARVKSGAVRCG